MADYEAKFGTLLTILYRERVWRRSGLRTWQKDPKPCEDKQTDASSADSDVHVHPFWSLAPFLPFSFAESMGKRKGDNRDRTGPQVNQDFNDNWYGLGYRNEHCGDGFD